VHEVETRVLERAYEGQHRLIHGDALEVCAAVAPELRGKVHLAYLDPPFGTQTDYTHEARLEGRADGRVARQTAYEDRWREQDGGMGAYLDMLGPRLHALRELLADTGTLWLHLDWRASYLARVLLDEIFGRDGFKNEIVWRRAPNLGRQAASAQFGRTLDTLLVYGGKDARIEPPTRLEPIEPKAVRFDAEGRAYTTAPRGDYTDASIAKLDAEGRVHRTATGKVYIKYFLTPMPDGTYTRARRVDALWTDVPPLRHAPPSERTGYPTQKPLALLERIIRAATPEGAWVMDVFGGSGTTAEAAARTGRRAVVGDISMLAIATARARLLRLGASGGGYQMERVGRVVSPERDDVLVEVGVARDGDAYEVCLRTPIEPLAWSVSCSPASQAFAVDAHSERGLGGAATPCMTCLRVGSVPRAVRVYLDDGTVLHHIIESALPR
jgi:DNA modification methylase